MIAEDKEQFILNSLRKGKNREALAKILGYQSYRAIHNYMTRRGYIWDHEQHQYISPDHTTAPRVEIPAEVQRILDLIENGQTLKQVANTMGYANDRELGEVMIRKGWEWSPERKTYLPAQKPLIALDEETEPIEPLPVEETTWRKDPYSNLETNLLEYLVHINERLTRLEDAAHKVDSKNGRTLARRTIPGLNITKSVHMSSRLADLLVTFSKEMNISQKEIVENALLEYLENYGYENAIKKVLV